MGGWGWGGVTDAPPLWKQFTTNENLSNLRLSWGQFHGNKVNFFIPTTTNWNHFSDDQVKVSMLPRFQTTDCPPQVPFNLHHLVAHLNQNVGPAMYAIKIKNCSITKQHTPGFFISSHTFISSSTSFIKWPPSYWRVAEPFIISLFLKTTPTNKQSSSVPAAFHISNQLDQSGYCLLISTSIYWHSCSHQTFRHGLQLKWPT